jgi:hypothetical protein
MSGRLAVKMTWAEIVALYRLPLERPPHNLESKAPAIRSTVLDFFEPRQTGCSGAPTQDAGGGHILRKLEGRSWVRACWHGYWRYRL